MKMNATPNPVGFGARALGRGGAFIAAADDATSASYACKTLHASQNLLKRIKKIG